MNADIFARIDALAATLRGLTPMKAEDQTRLDKKIRLEFNYNSNHLEGNTLTYSETELLLIFDETTGSHTKRELDEMQAHDVAFDLIRQWAADTEVPLTEARIRELNDILLVRPFWKEALTPDGQPTRRLIQPGRYKEHPNSVRLANGEMFHYTAPAETPAAMGELMAWYRDEERAVHPVTLAAMLHYRFVRIHPFDDGNGRIARLLTNYALLRAGLQPVIIRSADKAAYLRALHQADVGDNEPFIRYIAEREEEAMEMAVKAARGESIEEPDDLDKEIALWKRDIIAKEPDALPKSNHLIFQRYADSIKPLFEAFIAKQWQFEELFLEPFVTTLINDGGGYGITWLDDALKAAEVAQILYDKDEDDAPPEPPRLDAFHAFVYLHKFKKAGKNVFNVAPSLRCDFLEYEWSATNGKTTIKKLYTQGLSQDEINALVHEAVKETFTEIQSKIAKPL